MDDSPIAIAFPKLRKNIFRIEALWKNPVTGEPEGHRGTGFALELHPRNRRMYVATAGHLCEVPTGAEVTWRVQEIDEHDALRRECVFATRDPGASDYPIRIHKVLDIGLIYLPTKQPHGEPFVAPNETLTPVLDSRLLVAEGTRIAWAGYSVMVERLAGRPTLCYFEGTVMATLNFKEPDRPMYCVDGHCHQGVSGGPVWTCLVGSDEAQFCGIVSEWAHDSAGILPGFCRFELLNPLVVYVRNSLRQIENAS